MLKLSKDFKENAVFTLELEIEDTKENIKSLNNSKIIDWDFYKEEFNGGNEKGDEVETTTKDDCCEVVDPIVTPIFDSIYPLIKQKASPLFDLVNVCWKIKRKSPALRFTADIFTYFGRDVLLYDNSITPAELALSKMVNMYYDCSECTDSNWSLEAKLYDVLYKLQSFWSRLDKFETISDVVKELFGYRF